MQDLERLKETQPIKMKIKELCLIEADVYILKEALKQIRDFYKYLDEKIDNSRGDYLNPDRVFIQFEYNQHNIEQTISKKLAYKFVKFIQKELENDFNNIDKRYMEERKRLKEML